MRDSQTGVFRGLAGDVRYGLRSLRQHPALVAVALVTLSLGIGANAAIFSVVNAVLLQPLPFADPGRLVTFWGSAPQMGIPVVNYPDAAYVYFRTRSRALENVSAYASFTTTLTGAGEPERLRATAVTASFFALLGRMPQHGRAFLPEEEARARNFVTVLGHGLWQRRFGADPRIVGKTLTLDGAPHTVVGIMPPGFDFPNRAEMWMPLATDPSKADCWCYSTLGRLRAGRSVDDARRELARLSDDFGRERNGLPPTDPSKPPEAIVIARPLPENLAGEVRGPLLLILGAVAAVLLIACANVANLLLARATARGREIAVRCALGASPWRIVRQLLVEGLLLAATGAAVGLALAFWGVRALSALVVDRVSYLQDVALDPAVLLFSLAVTLATAVLFGLAPALRGARTDLQEAVKDGARAGRGAKSRRLNGAFVVVQVATSLVLLVGAGLLLRSFRNLQEIDLGFEPESVLVGRVSLASDAYAEPARARAFFDELRARVRGLPGVKTVGLASFAPFSSGEHGQLFRIKGREPAPGQPELVARIRIVSPDYFAAVGTPLVRGRTIDETDRDTSPPVAVVDETLARRFWPDGNALDREIRMGDAKSTNPWMRIVGVVKSAKHGNVTEDPTRHVYVPLAQSQGRSMDLVIRAGADPAALTRSIRGQVQAMDASLPFYDVHTLRGAVARTLGTRRLTNQLLLGFALTALLLAAIGIYGVMALGVADRFQEFGIRLALGAAPADVLRLVLRQGLQLVAIGVGIGAVAALGLTRSITAFLFGVKALDPLTFGIVALVMAAVALAACYVPARRATATDPLAALRHE
ncbi:MAG TPA: ABC transporter permease [Vicinamibacteria bacterium]|jgi:putative ABC transport system permease protein